MGMLPVWSCRLAPATFRPGFVSVPVRCHLRWRPLRASGWRMPMAATRRARIGAIWEDSPVSPIRSPRAALRADKLPGSDCCTPVRASAPQADSLLQSAQASVQPRPLAPHTDASVPSDQWALVPNIPAAQASAIYRGCMQRWRIADRFPQPDWSIVDLWVARHLLSQGTPAPRVETILRLASLHFPRRHHRPDDYLHRTLARAAFPAPGACCVTTSAPLPHSLPATALLAIQLTEKHPKAECQRCPPSDPNLTHWDGPPRV